MINWSKIFVVILVAKCAITTIDDVNDVANTSDAVGSSTQSILNTFHVWGIGGSICAMINCVHDVINTKETFCIWGNVRQGLSLCNYKQSNGNRNQSKDPLHFADFY